MNSKWRGTQLVRGLSLNLAATFLGAGLYLVPTEAGTIGLGPLVALLLIIMPPTIWLYQRVASAMIHSDSRGEEALCSALGDLGGPGKTLSFVALVCYVVPAILIYSELGTESLTTVASLGAGVLWGSLIATAALGLVLARLPLESAVVRRLLQLAVVWCTGVVVLATLHRLGVVSHRLGDMVGWACFAAGCVTVLGLTRPRAQESDVDETLETGHGSSASGLWIQLGLMLGMVVLAAIAAHFTLHAKHLLVPAHGSLSHPYRILNALATVLFMHVAVLGGICDYRAMADQQFRCRVVKWALRIVTATVVLWAVPVDLLYGQAGLQAIGHDNVNTVMGLHHVAPAHSTWAVMLTIGGSICALIATTNAAVSFGSGLCGEWIVCADSWWPARRGPRCKWRLTLVFLVGCTLLGAILVSFGTSVMAMVHVLPSSASVAIIVVIPWLTPSSRPRLMAGIALVCAIGGTALSIYLDLRAPGLGPVMHTIAYGFALAPLLAAAAAIRRLLTGPPTPPQAPPDAPKLAEPELATIRA